MTPGLTEHLSSGYLIINETILLFGKLETEMISVRCHGAIVSRYFIIWREAGVVAEHPLLFSSLRSNISEKKLGCQML